MGLSAADTADMLTMVRGLWPHSNIDNGNPVYTTQLWHKMLTGCERLEVEAAIMDLAASSPHAPPVGMILKAVTERRNAAPDFDEVKLEILTAIRKGHRRSADIASHNPYACPPPKYWSHPLVAQFAESVWDEWRMAPDPDCAEGSLASVARTFHAQQRDAYTALRARNQRAGALDLVGAPRGGGLQKPDFVGVLPRAVDRS